ncbi:glycoside hydrolase family 3 N-terminal domain-containing protein [Nocardia sp. NPDC127579]|uniref:glycoside hydrolase family 3 N-terminal domain-containing protein n=1 Tax=Nocardia sp. NPDC127579 TaxID=3345402 RepID=UPI00363BAD26
MRKTPLVLLAVLASVVTGCSNGGSSDSGSPEPAAPSSAAPATPVQRDCDTEFLAKFTPRQKLAQLLTVGVSSAADAENVVRTEQIGGIFVGSFTDRALLADGEIADVKAASKIPLMVTIDEEGGRVSRVKDLIGAAPSARETAKTMSPDEFYEATVARGRKLKDLGITVDFAPDVDVSSEPDDDVIGDRSFSDDPEIVTEYARAYIRAMTEVGLGSVMKHFPGHGSASGDSHQGAVRTPPLSELIGSDLLPYRHLIGTGAAVMVGHLDVPGLTTPEVPASISPETMALLRSGTGYGAAPFDGVIFTDDLSGMKAITARMDIADAVQAALAAGADNALWINTSKVTEVLDQLEQALASGALSAERIDDSVLRVAKYKGISTQC